MPKRIQPAKLDDPKTRERFLAAILARQGIKEACRSVGLGATQTFLYLSKPENHEFKLAADEARRAVGDVLFDECIQIADNTKVDTVTIKDDKGRPRVYPNHAAVARSRLQIDTRLRIAGKLRPKEYGEQPMVAVTNQSLNVVCDEETRAQIQEMRRKLLSRERVEQLTGGSYTYDNQTIDGG
jgi:hypothetical protein